MDSSSSSSASMSAPTKASRSGNSGDDGCARGGGCEEQAAPEEKDLFGSDNEEYQNTPAESPFAIPVLPVIQVNNKRPSEGEFERRVTGGNIYFGGRFSQGYGARNDKLVSVFRIPNCEVDLLSHVSLDKACQIAYYSLVKSGEIYFDDRSLKILNPSIGAPIGVDLSKGFESHVEKRDLGFEGFGNLLACIRNAKISVPQYRQIVTHQINLNKIMATPYVRNKPWKMGVHCRNGAMYLDVQNLPEGKENELETKRCFWGNSFINLLTKDSCNSEEDGKGIDANSEFYSVIQTELGDYNIIMCRKMDCCEISDSGRIYIEIRTTGDLEYRTNERYEREELLNIWIQLILAGVQYVIVGFRNDIGVLVRTERLSIKDITDRANAKQYWKGDVCLTFTNEVLCWLYENVVENEDYSLQFMPPFQSLKLLKDECCPSAITQHIGAEHMNN